MAERRTLLARTTQAPTVSPSQSANARGAFGDFSGIINAGQALQQVGSAATNYVVQQRAQEEAATARRARQMEEMNRAKMADMRLNTKNAMSLAVKGVLEQRNAALAAGTDDPEPYNSLRAQFGTARKEVDNHLKDLRADPLYRQAVPDSEYEETWASMVDSHEATAAAQQFERLQKNRMDQGSTRVETAFVSTPDGDHTAVLNTLGTAAAEIRALNIPVTNKLQLLKRLGDQAYDRVHRDIAMGAVAPDHVVRSPAFTPSQQEALFELNEKLKKPKDQFADTGEARKVLDQAINGPVINEATARAAADFIASKAESPEAKRLAHAEVDLKLAEQRITANNFEAFGKDQKLYQRLTTINAQFADEKTLNAFYDSLGVKGADPKSRDQFLTNIRARVTETLEKINTGRANEVADASDSVAPIAAATLGYFTSPLGIDRANAQRYVEASRAEQTRMGIPEDKQVHIPSKVMSLVTERIWDGDTNNASRMLSNIGEAFGAQALDGLSSSLLRPGSVPKDMTQGASKAKAGVYAALTKLMSADYRRVEQGGRGLELSPFLKQWMDDLNNWEKNAGQFPEKSATIATHAFNASSYSNPVTVNDLIEAKQVYSITSKTQSLPGIAQALWWHSGQNNDLSSGFKEMMVRIIQSQGFTPASPDSNEAKSHYHAVVGAVDRLNDAVARVMTVVDVSAPENKSRVLDVVPTRVSSEGILELPKTFGAADAVDMGGQISSVLQNISYWGPMKKWDRGFIGNTSAFATLVARDHPWVRGFLSTGSEGVLPLPANLQVDWERVHGISQSQFTLEGKTIGEQARKTLGPRNRYTENSVAFAQNGAWRYNWSTGNWDAMLFPGRSTSPATKPVSGPGPAQKMYYNVGTEGQPDLRPVTISGEDVYKFDAAYRKSRVTTNESSIEYIR